MAIRLYRAYSPGTRSRSSLFFDEITKNKPQKALTFGKKSSGGRNNRGVITLGNRGGGHKRKYRVIHFNRKESNPNADLGVVTAKVASIEYDPNRNVRIALLHYQDGTKRYILCPRSLKVGMTVSSGINSPIEIGSAMPLSAMPLGSTIRAIPDCRDWPQR